MMDFVFRRLALDHLPYATRESMGIFTTAERVSQIDAGGYQTMQAAAPSPVLPAIGTSSSATQAVHSSAELLKAQRGSFWMRHCLRKLWPHESMQLRTMTV